LDETAEVIDSLIRTKPTIKKTEKAYRWSDVVPYPVDDKQTHEAFAPLQIVTSTSILRVPAKWTRLSGLITKDSSEVRELSSAEADDILKSVDSTPEASRIKGWCVIAFDDEEKKFEYEGMESHDPLLNFKTFKVMLKNTIQANQKMIKLKLDFEYLPDEKIEQNSKYISANITVHSGQTIALSSNEFDDGTMLVLLLRPMILDSRTSSGGGSFRGGKTIPRN
jgi:hypothetical protein